MKILAVTRQDILKRQAGDTIQVLETVDALKRLDVDVDVTNSKITSLEGYDLVHFFGITRIGSIYKMLLEVEKIQLKNVVSPIFWPGVGKHQSIAMKRRRAIRNSSLLLPNSEVEANVILNHFGQDFEYKVIPNAVELRSQFVPETLFFSEFGFVPDVICVARIEQRKNQLNLIKSLAKENVKLVLIGDNYNKRYLNECKEASGKNVKFIGRQSRDMVSSAMKLAKVHAMPSFYDTPGLSHLEAGLLGCNLVCGNCGVEEEYFGEHAIYCNPHSTDSIRGAVMYALEEEKSGELPNIIMNNYNWGVVAEKTLESYHTVLSM